MSVSGPRLSPAQAAYVLRGLATSVVLRAMENSDAAGRACQALADVADEIEKTDALPNSADLDRFIGRRIDGSRP